MSKVIQKFLVASALMWVAPVMILYGFSQKLFPGSGQLSSSSHTLVSGFCAVISVNVVIVFYVLMALRERPSTDPQPDPTFLAEAKASISQSATADGEDPAKIHHKEE